MAYSGYALNLEYRFDLTAQVIFKKCFKTRYKWDMMLLMYAARH